VPLRLLREGRSVKRRSARQASLATRVALVLACGCARETRRLPVAWIVVEPAREDQESVAALDSARIGPESAVVQRVRSGGRLMVAIDLLARSGEVRVDSPGACPLAIQSSELAPGSTQHRRLTPRLDLRLPPHPRDLGYDAPFVIQAVVGCGGAPAGSVTWRQVSGPSLRDARTGSGGLRFEARTTPRDGVALDPPDHGIVPISPRTSAAIAIEAEWHPGRAGEAPVARRRIELASASRARGLPNVGVDEGILLAGAGWSIATAPRDAAASLEPANGLTRLVPDVSGPWVLHDVDGRTVSLRAGRYDETPLDCGRSGCHSAIADAAQRSPMTGALRILAGDEPRSGSDVACAIACHATGEPGTHDGGFADVLGAHDVEVAWSSLPRTARRLGGVTCLACHGPGAIPEPSASWAILRADVCATCHDAPPTYGHVAAWRASRMARSDADVEARTDATCAPCHTTSGFLASIGGGGGERVPPPDVEPIGIACAACHAPHDTRDERHGVANGDHLLRAVSLPAPFDRVAVPGPSRICIRCHAPEAPPFATRGGARSPAASAAAIWAGRGGVDPRTGAPFEAAPVHEAVDEGCVGCHATGPTALERGAGHGFKAGMTGCTACHATTPEVGTAEHEIHERAAAVLARLAGMRPSRSVDRPHHAARRTVTDDPVGRATYDALLVLEDPAAAAHNAPFARALLEVAGAVAGDAP